MIRATDPIDRPEHYPCPRVWVRVGQGVLPTPRAVDGKAKPPKTPPDSETTKREISGQAMAPPDICTTRARRLLILALRRGCRPPVTRRVCVSDPAPPKLRRLVVVAVARRCGCELAAKAWHEDVRVKNTTSVADLIADCMESVD